MDHDRFGSNDFMGQCEVDLASLPVFQPLKEEQGDWGEGGTGGDGPVVVKGDDEDSTAKWHFLQNKPKKGQSPAGAAAGEWGQLEIAVYCVEPQGSTDEDSMDQQSLAARRKHLKNRKKVEAHLPGRVHVQIVGCKGLPA